MFSHLKPGVGHLEQIDFDFEPRCDDGTLLENSIWKEWYNRYLTEATTYHSRPIAYNHNTQQILEALGFVDVHVQKIQVPVGEWSPGKIDMGRYYRVALSDSVEPMSLAVFTREDKWNWPVDAAKFHLNGVRGMVNDARIHAYNNL